MRVASLMLVLGTGCVEDTLRRAPEDTSEVSETDETDVPPVSLDADLTDLDAGSWLVGCTSRTQTRRIRNPNDHEVVFLEPVLSGADADRFTVQAPDVIPARGEGQLVVTFTPKALGPASADVALPYVGGALQWTVAGRGGEEVVWTDSRWMPDVDALDLVLVLDTTASTTDEQDASYDDLRVQLASGLDLLDLDWRFGVTGVDMQGSDPGTGGRFATGVITEASGDTLETVPAAFEALPAASETRPLDAAIAAVTSANTDFRREGVPLGVLIVADEDDAGSRTPAAVRAALGDEGTSDVVSVSAIAGSPLVPCAIGSDRFGTPASAAPRIEAVVDDSGGARVDWCARLSDVTQLSLEWPLRATGTPQAHVPAATPKPKAVVGVDLREVVVGGLSVPSGSDQGWTWSAQRRAVELHGSWLAAPGTRVDLVYAIDPADVCDG